MTLALFQTILRQILIALFSALAAKGIIEDTSLAEPIVAGGVAVAAAVWGLVAKKRDQAKIKELE